MSESNSTLADINEISLRLDRLLEVCHRLTEENRSLRQSKLSKLQLTGGAFQVSRAPQTSVWPVTNAEQGSQLNTCLCSLAALAPSSRPAE